MHVVDARLAALGEDLADAMVLFGLGRMGAGEYARRARRVKDERAGLEALRARHA